MNRIIPYGIMNYAELVEKNGYFIDKTKYIKKLETIQNPVFLRPRRFGKSLFSSMLQYYYGIREADRFSELFGSTWIGNNPTGNQNKYIVLKLDFSRVPLSDNIRTIEQNFNRYGNNLVELIVKTYASWFPITPPIRPEESVVTNLGILLDTIRLTNAPQILIIIDEYDNFSNQLLTSHQDALYHHITTSDSFLRSFFKVLKEGRQSGSITNIFITGVLPITIDELASGYNIATFLTLDPQFDAMLGFTQTEVDSLINQVYHEYEIDPASRKQVNEVIKSQYN